MLKKPVIKYLIFGLIFIQIICLQSCKILDPSVMFKTDKNYDFKEFEHEIKEYLIRPYDKLNVRIYTNDGIQLIDMAGDNNRSQNNNNTSPYMVDQDGNVKVPTLGWVKLGGITIKEAEKILESRYSQYYQKPFVLVNVTNRRVVVFTAGSTSGTVLAIENEHFTLVEALAQAGGIDDFSKSYKIKLLRGDLNNPEIFMYNISSIEDMKKANLVLQANDIIYVERKARYAARTLNEIMPYIALLNTFLLLFVTIQAL